MGAGAATAAGAKAAAGAEAAASGGAAAGGAATGGGAAGLLGPGLGLLGSAAGGAALGYCIYRGFQDEIDGLVEDIFGDPAPELSKRRPDRDPNRPNRKKQGREGGDKKRKHKDWKHHNDTPPKEPPRHTPSKPHRKK